MSYELILTGLLQGLNLALVAYAIMIPFRLLNFSDLSVEGSYPLGGAICACSLGLGLPTILAISLSALGAGLVGIFTSIMHLRLRVNTMLCGIIVSHMAYSLNLRIMGKPNLALFEATTLFDSHHPIKNLGVYAVILGVCFTLLNLFLRTDFGLKLRAVGLNPDFSKHQEISIKRYTIFGLFLAGILSGLSGSLMVQLQNYMDIGMGFGIVIHGLASLIIGEALIGKHTMTRQLFAPLIGALMYQQIQGVALSLGLAPTDLKFFTGGIVLLVIAMKKEEKGAG